MKILDKLEYEKVVEFTKEPNVEGLFRVTEMNEWYFFACISKDELLMLAEELKELAES